MPKHDFHILYVDDEEQNLVSFRASFRRDYHISTAKSADEGLQLLAEQPAQLIITDQRMPHKTGVQFLEEVLPLYPDAVRMVLTAFSDVDAIIEAINLGRVFRYVTKPWDEQELRMTIENGRQLYQLQQRNKNLIGELKSKVEEQERILRLFQKYVPEPVVEKALSSAEDTILEGEIRSVAVLFCDIRGFTDMSEDLSPREVVGFLNEYYTRMTNIVKRHGGNVNQFVGDEVFAAFGAPLAIPQPELQAVRCAVEMVREVKKLSAEYEKKSGRPIEVGIGLNAGEVIAGNLGSEDRIEYSLTGDVVNTGKRIETLTKIQPNTIYLSDSVERQLNGLIPLRQLSPVRVKGKKNPLQVYEVLLDE